MTAVYWLIGIIVLLVIEAMTLGLTTIWFAGGALVAFAACVLGADLAVQVILFVVVSLVLLIFTRPFARRCMEKGQERTNAESLIGQEARVTVRIDNRAGTGEVVINGQEWSARAGEDREILEPGRMVLVERIQGVKLIVKPCEGEEGV